MDLFLRSAVFGMALLFAASMLTAAVVAQTAAPPESSDMSTGTVTALQEALNGQGIAVKVDGVLDEETRAAIRRYQSQHHLPVTGEPDEATLDKLGVADRRSDAPAGAPMSGPAIAGSGLGGPGRMGMMGPQTLQMMPGMMGGQGMGPAGGAQPGTGAMAMMGPMGGMAMPMQPGMMMCPMMAGMMPMGPGPMGSPMPGMGVGPGTIYGMPRMARADLGADQVAAMLRTKLAWHGNPRLRLGEVQPTEAGEILAEIVTQDGSLVQKLAVDRRTGGIRQVD